MVSKKRTSPTRVQRTLTLSEELDKQLRIEAAKLEIPISYFVEQAIAAYLMPTNQKDVA